MIGYNYNFTSFEEILESIPRLGELSFPVLGGTLLTIIIVVLCIYILFPLCIILIQDFKETKEKQNKKRLLQQILLQKEIEDEVEKEIKIQEENEVT